MSYQHGTAELNINNPFKTEGIIILLRGLITASVGIAILVFLKSFTKAHGVSNGWFLFASALIIGLHGGSAILNGASKLFRFYVGRSAPSSLAASVELDTNDGVKYYSADELKQMLINQANPTYITPIGYVESFLHTLFKNLIFTPPPIRVITNLLLTATLDTMFITLIYFTGVFIYSAGLIPHYNLIDQLGWISLFAIIVSWTTRFSIEEIKFNPQKYLKLLNFRGLWTMVALSCYTPQSIINLEKQFSKLSPYSPETYIVITSICALAIFIVCFRLILARAPKEAPETNASEERDHWQENIHPDDLFRCFNINMTLQRFKKIVNRTYISHEPHLQQQGSTNKGDFSGAILQETQPKPLDSNKNIKLNFWRLTNTLTGQTMILVAMCYWGYFSYHTHSKTLIDFIAQILPALPIFVFGNVLAKVSSVFWSELFFESNIALYSAEGTYTESKVSTGMAWQDSNRSENAVVRSNITSGLFTSTFITSTFVQSHNNSPFASARFVLDMKENEGLKSFLLSGFRKFLNERNILAAVASEADLKAMNEIKSYNSPQQSFNARASLGLDIERNENLLEHETTT